MKDLIAKLQMDANCALGAIWMHIDAQEKRIAELERQLQDHSAQAFSIGETYANALSRIAELEAQIAASADTDKLREALKNLADASEIFMAGGVVGLRSAIDKAHVLLSATALQAPVREVPGWQPIETAPKDGTRIMIFMGAPWARIVTVRWFDLWENWQEGDFPEDKEEYCGIGSLVPTHWMPLPAAPVQQEGEKPSIK